jgi:hypothetical protein
LPFIFGRNRSKIKIINYPETNQADADEGQIAQDFPPYQMIRFAAILKKGGNPLRTAPLDFGLSQSAYHYTIKSPNRKALRWFSADRCNGASIALPPGVDAPFLFFPL